MDPAELEEELTIELVEELVPELTDELVVELDDELIIELDEEMTEEELPAEDEGGVISTGAMEFLLQAINKITAVNINR